MKIRRVLIVLIYLLITSLNIGCFAFSLASQQSPYLSVAFGLQCLFTSVLALSASWVMNCHDQTKHWNSLVQLSILSTLTVVATIIAVILPAAKRQLPSAQSGAWYTTFALHLAAWLVIVTVPSGPDLHFESANIYSEKTLSKTSNYNKANVCGITGLILSC